MKALPKIQKYMTPMPHSIGTEQDIKKAQELMHQYDIRHLPVQEAGKLVGILTDRDVKFATTFEGSEKMSVSDAMIPDPFTCHPDSSLKDVVEIMAEKKLGCVLVVQENGKLVGIFTSVDATRVLAELLAQNYREA